MAWALSRARSGRIPGEAPAPKRKGNGFGLEQCPDPDADVLPDGRPWSLGGRSRRLRGGRRRGRVHGAEKIDTHDRGNWDRIADWLHERRKLYEHALLEVGAEAKSRSVG